MGGEYIVPPPLKVVRMAACVSWHAALCMMMMWLLWCEYWPAMCVHESGMLERESERLESPVANISTTFITTFASSQWGKYVPSTPFYKVFFPCFLWNDIYLRLWN